MSTKTILIHLVRILVIVPILLFCLSTITAFAFPFREIKEGGPLPEVTLTPMEQGKPEIQFSGLQGKPYIVIFWGADLPEKVENAAQILGEIEGLKPFLDERGVQRYSVNVQNDAAEAIQEVVKKAGSTINVYLDANQKAYAALGIFVMPAILLVDKDGNVAAGMGYSHDLADRLKGSIEIMLGEKTAEQVEAELRPEMKEATAEEKASHRHFNYGMVMVKRGQFDSAIREFAKTVEIDPGMVEAHLQLGCLYLGRNDLENAEIAINNALAAEPESVPGRICKGELLRLRKQLAEALGLLQKVIESHPESFKAHYQLGRVLEDQEKQQEAMQSYKKAYLEIQKNSKL